MRFGGIFDYDRKALRLNEVNAALENPTVWNEPKRAQELGFTLEDVDKLLYLDAGGPDSCDAARVLAEQRRADLERRITDLQRMHESLTALVDTCGLPRADRSCPLLEALTSTPEGAR